MNLYQHYNSDKYNGLMSVSDIHSSLAALIAAIEYARSNNLFIVFLGDLVDGGVSPFEVLQIVKEVLDRNEGVLCTGNHDSKLYRFSIGNNVTLNPDNMLTISKMHDLDAFKRLMGEVFMHPNTALCHFFGKTTFVHAAVYPKLWDDPDYTSAGMKSMSLYGEVNGEYCENGMPIRTYEWVSLIPDGYTAVVGHDRQGLGKPKLEPLVSTNERGGTVYFTDTSCGKQEDGPLTGTVFYTQDKELQFVHFKTFT